MQTLNTEIAALIRAFERSMDDFGYRSIGGSAATEHCSTSLSNPERWMPPWFYRMFENAKAKDDVIILNVILDEPDEPDKIEEPLVLCARFLYTKGGAQDSAGAWDTEDLWLYGKQKNLNRVYDLNSLGIDSAFLKEADWEAIDNIEDIRFIAVPLVEMSDTKTLHDRVIQPLLKG
jgi:hypothetical protein